MKRKTIYSLFFVIGLVLAASAGRVNNPGKDGCCCRDAKPVKVIENTKEFSINPVMMLFS